MSFHIKNLKDNERPKPRLWLAKPDKTIIERLDGIEELSGTFNFMNQNELTFNVNAFLYDEIKNEQVKNPAIHLIKNKYLLKFTYLNQEKWFVIDSKGEVSEEKDYIPVVAKHIGSELDGKYIGDIEEIGVTPSQIINKYLAIVAPNWKLANIDEKIVNVKRTYELSNASISNLLESVTELTDSVIKFHDKERKFSLIHNDNAGQFKGLKVKEETYLKGYSDSKDSTNLVTRLVLFGKDNMTINSVNPAGTSYIEDFSFYMRPFKRDAQRNIISHSDYLSDELCHALLDYQEYFENKRNEYEDVTESYGNLLTEQLEEEFKLMEYEGVLQRLEDRIELLKPHGAYRELTVSSSRNIELNYATYYMILVENRGSLARVNFNNQEHFIQPNSYEYIKVRTPESVEVGEDSDSYPFEVLSANTNLRLAISTSSENDFEEEDTEILDERYNLNKYKSLVQEQRAVVATIERRLTTLNNNRLSINHSLLPSVFFTPKLLEERENFVHWGVYTEENHTVPEELLQDGLTQLAEKNNVERQIEAQLVDFLQSLEPEDRENWDKLTAGDIILFSNKTYDANMQAFISELRINFDSHEIDLTISDVIDFRSKQSGIAKRLAAFASTASQVNLHRTQLLDAEGKINEVTRLLEGEWDANLRRISAANETVSIDNRGLVIQSPTHPNEMLVAVAGVIAISDDYGMTFKQAINTRGVVAEQIIGKLLIGNDLILENDSGKVRFDNDGLRINADSFHLVSDDGENYFDTLLARIGADIVSVEETIKEQIENQRESLIGEIGDLDSALTDYTSTLINALADGMLTEQEILKLQLQLNMLEVEYQQVEKRVVRVIQDVYVDPVIQENLYFRYKELESMYTKLVTFIRNLDEPIEVPQETIENIIDLINQFKPTLVELVGAIEEALENSQITQIFNAEYHSMEYADKLSDDLEDEIRDLNEAMELFEDVFDEALSDGILTMLEKNSMSDAMLRLRSEKRDIDNRYLLIYNHPQLSENTSVKQNLSNAKSAYDSSFVLLEEKVELFLTLDKVTVEQVEEYKTRYEAFADEVVNYQEIYELALEAIQMSYADDAEGRAKEYADGLRIEIQADIEDVEANLTEFETEVNGAYRDGIITEQEKRRLDIHMEMLGKEKGDVIERYNTIVTSPDLQGYYDIQPLVRARQAYGDIHASLILSIQTAMLDSKITKEEGNEATRLFDEYADALANFSSELELAVAALGEVKAVRFTEGELEGYVTSIFLGQQLEEIKAQVDGHIKTYYYDYAPTMNNIPASEWTTTEDKEVHVGDLFFNNETGVAYRFTRQGSTFGWVEVKDNEVTKALKDAQDALDLADNKRRVFVVTPIPPYDVGDLWIREDKEMMRARTAKDENGNYSVSDWIVATKYTDDTKANAVENALTAYKTSNNKEIKDLKDSLSAFQNTVEGAFKDGIIEEYELKIIESNINALNREKADVDAGYNQLINHDKITGSRRTRLQTTYQAFQSTHQGLIDAINAAVLDGKISENEMSQINALFEDYPVKLKAYKDEMNEAYLYLIQSADDKAGEAIEAAGRFDTWRSSSFEVTTEEIATRVGESEWSTKFKPELKGEVDTQLEELTDELDEKFEEINDNALGINESLTDTFKDGIITTSEVEVISNSLNILKADYENIIKKYESVYNNSDLKGTPKTSLQTARKNYVDIYDILTSLINSVVGAGTISSGQKTAYNNNFATYQTRIGQLSNALEVALNAITQEKANKASSGAVNNFHENTIKSQYSTTEQTKTMISSSVKDINLSGELSKVSQGYAEYEVNRTTYANLTEADGSLMDDAFSYEIAVQRVGDDTSLYAAVFSSEGKGNGWERTELEVKGQTGSHPELYAEDGNIRLRTMGTSDMQGMEVIYTKYIGSFTNVKRVSSQIKQESDNILLEVGRVTDGKELVSRINQTPEEIRLSASKIVFEVTGRNLEEEIENIELTPGPQGTGIVETTITYASSSNGTTAPSSGYSSQVPSVSKGHYLWTRTQWKYSDGSVEVSHTPTYMGQDGNSGDDGAPGKDGVGITDTVIRYASSSSGVNTPILGWSDKIPDVPAGHYLWMRTVWHYSDDTTETAYSVSRSGEAGPRGLTGLTGLEGPQGDQGIQGPKGDDGVSSYTHIAYATGATGQNFSTSHFSSATYIGMYVSDSSGDSEDYRDYKWTLIKGANGARGIEGPKGDNGLTPYFHTAWANNSTGSSGFSTTASLGKTYIGTVTTYEPDDPEDPKVYSWVLIKGDKGDKGDTGEKGATGSRGPQGAIGVSVSSVTEYYLATSASSGIVASNSGFTTTIQTMTATNKYLWNYEKINFSDGTSQPTIPVIIGVYGDKGQTGSTGATGRSITSITEHYLATSASSGVTRSTSGWSTTMKATTETNKYLWNYETINWSSGTTPTYVEPIIIGVHGAKGDKGDTGARGATGAIGPRGATGTSVSSVTEYYLASSSSSGVTTGTSGWSTSMKTMTATLKYLWNYEKINFSDGTSQDTIPVVIGVYGDKGGTGATGRSITGITEHYLASSSKTGVTRSTSGWTTTMQTTTPTNQYLWNYETITWSSGTSPTYVDPIIIGVHGAKGDKGATGATGPQGVSPIVGLLTNESITLPASSAGAVSTFTGATGTFEVYDGTTRKTGSGIAYSVSGTPSNITVSINPTTGVYTVSAMTTGASVLSGTATLRAVYGGVTIDKILTVTKALAGTQGGKGATGSTGATGASGKDGVAGKDGKGISSTAITYVSSASGTTKPTSGWTPTVPSLTKGQYLWTRTIWTYTDSTTETGYSVSYIAKDGNNGTNGIAGKDGVGIKSTSITYTGSTSGTVKPTSGWNTAVPTVAAGSFLWTRTIWTYTDNTTETGYSVARMGSNGAAGATGSTGATGSAGQNATSYWINASVNAIKKDVLGNIVPKTITFSGFSKTGTANPVAYAGRFIIQTSENGTSYTTRYTSSANQSSYTYTIPATASFVKVRYYLAGGTSVLLDEQTVPVLVDAEGIEVGGRNLLLKSGETVTNSSYNIARYDLAEEIKAGEEVTLTLWGELAPTKSYFRAYNSGGSITVATLSDNGDGTHSATFKWTISTSNNTYLNIYAFTNAQSGTSTIEKIQLERGNSGSDWTPAPEDVDGKIQGVNSHLESELSAQSARIDSKANSSALTTAINKLEGDIEAEESRTSALQKSLKDLDSVVVGMTADLKDTASVTKFVSGVIIDYDGGTLIGNVDTQEGVHISPNRIDFLQNGQSVAHISNQQMQITRGIFTSSLTVGGHTFLSTDFENSTKRRTVIQWTK